MLAISITSNYGKLDSASAVFEVGATNPKYNQPALRIKQASTAGGAASIRINDSNPDIEFVEACLETLADPGAGKFAIVVQADQLQINWSQCRGRSQERLRQHCCIYQTTSGRQYRNRIPRRRI